MKIWKMLPFTAALLAIQAQGAPASPFPLFEHASSTPLSSVPLYRVMIVQGNARAINYRNLKSSTRIDLKGTVLAPGAMGKAKVESDHGGIQIEASFKDLPPASTFGNEYLTYVLWGISPEGRATNLGEIVLKRGKGKIEVSEKLQTFGLVVTAEPYFAVSQPSDVVIMENVVGKDTQGQVETIDAKYELLKRGQYIVNLNPDEPIVMKEDTPFILYQARNAVRIARASGASIYAADAYGKAESYLQQAESNDEGEKNRVMNSGEAVQRAEDARLIAVQRQEAEQVAMDKQLAHDKLDAANRDAAAAAAAAANAQNAANQQTLAANQQTQAVESENERLRARLLVQLNAVLQTRATARGLIVNMSGVLFQNGKATLVPAAREKLAKIAGILSAHKGLRIEADGYTDSNGSEESNQRLSEQRAGNARDYLVSQGVSPDAITSKGFGEGSPISSNETASGRQDNRRVELVVSGEGLTAPLSAGL